jgi:hypothetical protein
MQISSWLAHSGKRLKTMSTAFSSRHESSQEEQNDEPAHRRGEHIEHTKGQTDKYDVAEAIGAEV